MQYSCGVPAGMDQPVSYAQELASRYREAHKRLIKPQPPKQFQAPLPPIEAPVPPAIEQVKPELNELSPQSPELIHPLTLDQLIRWVACAEDVSVLDITGRCKNYRVRHPRKIFYYLAYVYTDASYATIGRFCNNRDHSTVIDGVQRVACWIKEDVQWRYHVRCYTDPLEQHLREVNAVCPLCGSKKAAPVA